LFHSPSAKAYLCVLKPDISDGTRPQGSSIIQSSILTEAY
jgi:hypothetical protein